MNIIKNRVKFFAVSIVLILAGIIFMIINGVSGKGSLNFDTDFTGGTAISIDMGREFENDEIANVIKEVTGQTSPQIQKIMGTTEVSIKMQSIDGEMRTKLLTAFKEKLSITDDNILSISDVSGTVSGEMQRLALMAVFVSCVAMLIYISIRFKDVRTGASAIIALLHDVLIMLAFYAVFRVPVNNSFIAAMLTVLGYSINSTIVIFDRIRENKSRYRMNQTEELINKSVTQTLGRSINTSITTLFTIGAIYILGVQSIKEFALPLIVGIISGAYSSIFISGSVWYILLPEGYKKK